MISDHLVFLPRFLVPPAPPTKLYAKDRMSNSATIGWERPKHFEVDTYHVEIWDGQSKKWLKPRSVTGEKNSETLGDLEPETIYNITMHGENKYGVGEKKSNILQVETKKGTVYFY